MKVPLTFAGETLDEPTCRNALSPQQTTEPLLRTEQVCQPPASISRIGDETTSTATGAEDSGKPIPRAPRYP